MNHQETCVAIYPKHILAEEAVAQLRRAGFGTENVSIVGRGHDHAAEVSEDGCGGNGWQRTALFWGGIWEVGSATFYVPDIGLLVVAGPLSRWVHGALESGFVLDGLGPVGVALHAVGVPTESARRYEGEIRENRCLLVLPCPEANVGDVALALRKTGPRELRVHECENLEAHRPGSMLESASMS